MTNQDAISNLEVKKGCKKHPTVTFKRQIQLPFSDGNESTPVIALIDLTRGSIYHDIGAKYLFPKPNECSFVFLHPLWAESHKIWCTWLECADVRFVDW